MQKSFTLILLFLTLITKAQQYSGPESVEFDSLNDRWLVANTQSHQIIARDSNGILTVFKSGFINGPYGLEISGDTLFCCSGSFVKGYLLSDATEVFSINTGAAFLNGITHDNSGNLYVTDFSNKTIIRINVPAQADSIIANNLIQSPNGILFDDVNNRCVFVNWGSSAPVKAIDLSTYSVTIISSTTLNNCDGIAMDALGNYYISHWGGQSIAKFDNQFNLLSANYITGMSNPADISFNSSKDTLAIPNSSANTVAFVPVNTSTGIETFDYAPEIYIGLSGKMIQVSFESIHAVNLNAEILDINGKSTGTVYRSDAEQISHNFNVEISLQTGIYLIRMNSNEKVYIRKIYIP